MVSSASNEVTYKHHTVGEIVQNDAWFFSFPFFFFSFVNEKLALLINKFYNSAVIQRSWYTPEWRTHGFETRSFNNKIT